MTQVRLAAAPAAYGQWVVWLIGEGGEPIDGYDLAADVALPRRQGHGTLDGDGEAIVELLPTDAITPAGTRYRAELRAAGVVALQFPFGPVPDSDEVVNALDLLSDVPGALPPPGLAAETTARIAGDAALQDQIEDLGGGGDPVLGGVLTGTASAAAFAQDMATQAELNAEAAARATADTGLLPVAGHTANSIPAASGSTSLADLAVPTATLLGRAGGPIEALAPTVARAILEVLTGDETAAAIEAAVDAEATARAAADGLLIPLTQKAAANGVATLDAGSKIPAAQLPSIAISDFLGTVASEAAMLALVGQRGDWCNRSDLSQSLILVADDASVLANWQVLLTPTDAVASVNGRTGVVIGLAEQTALDAEATARAAADTTLATEKAPLASPTFTGTPAAPTAAAGTNTSQLATTAFVAAASGLLVPKSLVDAKGDLLAGSADDTVARLPVGTNGQVLTADSAEATGLKWATPSSGGASRVTDSGNGVLVTHPAADLVDVEFTGPTGGLTGLAMIRWEARLGQVMDSGLPDIRFGAPATPELRVNRDRVMVEGRTAATVPLTVRGKASQSADVQRWTNDADAVLARIDKAGSFVTARTSAPADGDLAAGELAFWFDQTNGAARLMVKAKEAGGTVRSGTFPLADLASVTARTKRQMVAQVQNAINISQYGMQGPSVTGTAFDGTDSEGAWRGYQTSASIGAFAGWQAGAGEWRREWEPDALWVIKQQDLAAVRLWVGFFSSGNPTGDDPAIHGAMFRFSTAAGDGTNGNWRAWSNDGSGGGTITDTGVPITTNAVQLGIAMDATQVVFKINGTVVATHTTNLPSASGVLFWTSRVEALAAAFKILRMSRVEILQKG